MPKFAIILNTLVENVILANAKPTITGRTIVDVSALAVSPGDSYDGTTFTPYQPNALEIQRRDAPVRIRQAYIRLRQLTNQANTIGNAVGNPTQAQIKQLFLGVGDIADAIADIIQDLAKD